MSSKTYPIRVADGGRLVTALSLENVGEANWSRKLNMRRFKDREIRREGWIKFVDATGYVFDGTESLLRMAELVRPNGDRVIVGASRTKIKKFNTSTGAWTDIAGGLTFSASGKRWQVCSINGYLILNNAVDLPVSYRVEDAAVSQIHELRQVGICRVGRICEYNGFLMIGDITEIKAVQLDTWMNGYGNYTQATNSAKVANFSVVIGEHQNRYDVTTGAGTITATLPALTFSQRMYVWIKKVDAGAGTVVTSPVIADEAMVLTAQNDIALVWWNGTAWVSKVFAAGTIPATDPYGTPPASITNRLPAAVGNSEFGEPRKWAPLFEVIMAAAGTTLTLPFNPNTYVARTTRIAVINGGPDGTTLGGQIGYEDGVLITAIGAFSAASMGVPITIEVTTGVSLTYPRNVQVTRFTDISTIVARYLLTGDGSEMVGMQKLGDLLVCYRSTCIYVGRYTGDATNPFVFTPRYPGDEDLNLPVWGDAIANIGGDYHLYPGVGGRFYKFDGVSWPTIHGVCDDARELFFSGVLNTDEVFAVANPYTKEIWFCRPSLTFAYDFEFNTVSEIDAVIAAAAFVRKPSSTDRWFIIAIGRFVYTYGLVANAATNIQTWLRDSVAPSAEMKSGLIHARLLDQEKMLLSYCPVLASASPEVAVMVRLYGTHNPSAVLSELMTGGQALPTPAGENFFTTAYQAMFFQDKITLTAVTDVDFQLSHRLLEFDRVGSGGGVPRRVTA